MIVERRENVLRIASIDPLAIAVEHVDIHKMRPRIDRASFAQTAAAANGAVAADDLRIHPHFVGIDRALRERMPQLQRAQHGLEQISRSWFQRRDLWPQRRDQLAIDRPAFLQREEIHAHSVFQKILMPLYDLGFSADVRDAGVRRGKQMVVNV